MINSKIYDLLLSELTDWEYERNNDATIPKKGKQYRHVRTQELDIIKFLMDPYVEDKF